MLIGLFGIIVAFVVIGLYPPAGTFRVNDSLRHKVDSLNEIAYATRYMHLDSTAKYSQLAFDQSADYDEGRAIALNNLAFVQYMLMDYDSAQTLYLESYFTTNNLIIKAAADVGIMKICQITSRNDAFYDYRNDAEYKLRRIEEDKNLLTPIQTTWYNYVKSEFHFASATYYNNIQQEVQGDAELQRVTSDMSMVNSDSAQLARYCLLTHDYDRALEIGRRSGLTYMLASALQKIANSIINSETTDNTDSLSSLPLELARHSLQLFRDYGSIYSRAVTYLTISEYYVHRNQPEVALDTATKALEFVNIQHRRLYGVDAEFLMPYSSQQDSMSTEMRWMRNGTITCAWDWIAQIREHLSMVYSSLGQKRQSDYNRNIYLDILNATRQDKQLENQYENLEIEQARQYIMAWMVAILSVLLFLGLFLYIRFLKRRTERSYNKDIAAVEETFHKWMKEKQSLYSSMQMEEKRIDSETYIHEQHIAENKRSYIDKCTSLSLVYSITPFLDRAINELHKLRDANEPAATRKERLSYLMELIEQINLYNEILSHWIKVRQGIVSLNIENFKLQPLLDTLAKSNNSFIDKGLSLHVENSDAVVKADRALTLFMMNTLLDNARKYTPQGGHVSINTLTCDDYVEISVSDTGRGLSTEDMETIRHEKVYDSSKIGDTKNDSELKQNKGFGFGLMNCKGIIDKYRKSNSLFSVCLFDVESTIGKGSRFFFRLPKGTIRSIITAALLILTCNGYSQGTSDTYSHVHLKKAAAYADSVYFANIDGYYHKAIVYADSVIQELNAEYITENGDSTQLLTLLGQTYQELDWWNTGVKTDYSIILDVRNETAVAALALQNWDLYKYNNDIYQRLYKLANFDYSLEESVETIHKTNIIRQTIISIGILLVLIGIVVFLLVYYRMHLLPTFNMRQLMQLNKNLFTQQHNDLTEFIYRGLNDIKQTDGLAIGTKTADKPTLDIHLTANCPAADSVETLIIRSVSENKEIVISDGALRSFLLIPDPSVSKEEEPVGTIGAMVIAFHNTSVSADEEKIIRLIAQQLATYIYYSNIKVESQRDSIQLKEYEKHRTEQEESSIHIQNMVLDNCLSALKHETMFYPNRIKQILSSVGDDLSSEEMAGKIETLNELISYYKEIFSILSACAAKQLDNVVFKRKNVSIDSLVQYAQKSLKRQSKKKGIDIDCEVHAQAGLSIIGDAAMLQYLIDNIISSMLQDEQDGQIKLYATYNNEGMVKLTFTDCRIHKSKDELSKLFYPEHLKYDEQEDKLIGVEYMVCRQIVREHDEYGGRRGCRINISNCDEGYKIEVMLNGQKNNVNK